MQNNQSNTNQFQTTQTPNHGHPVTATYQAPNHGHPVTATYQAPNHNYQEPAAYQEPNPFNHTDIFNDQFNDSYSIRETRQIENTGIYEIQGPVGPEIVFYLPIFTTYRALNDIQNHNENPENVQTNQTENAQTNQTQGNAQLYQTQVNAQLYQTQGNAQLYQTQGNAQLYQTQGNAQTNQTENAQTNQTENAQTNQTQENAHEAQHFYNFYLTINSLHSAETERNHHEIAFTAGFIPANTEGYATPENSPRPSGSSGLSSDNRFCVIG